MIQERLDALRAAIEAEDISYGEIAELQSLAEHIDPSDVVLREWAGVPEFAEPVFRDYTIHLKVRTTGDVAPERIDACVEAALEYSTAREAIATALESLPDGEVENLYVVSATRPEGGIE